MLNSGTQTFIINDHDSILRPVSGSQVRVPPRDVVLTKNVLLPVVELAEWLSDNLATVSYVDTIPYGSGLAESHPGTEECGCRFRPYGRRKGHEQRAGSKALSPGNQDPGSSATSGIIGVRTISPWRVRFVSRLAQRSTKYPIVLVSRVYSGFLGCFQCDQ